MAEDISVEMTTLPEIIEAEISPSGPFVSNTEYSVIKVVVPLWMTLNSETW